MPSLTERWGPPVGAFFYLAQPPSPPRTTAHPATSPTFPSPPRATRSASARLATARPLVLGLPMNPSQRRRGTGPGEERPHLRGRRSGPDEAEDGDDGGAPRTADGDGGVHRFFGQPAGVTFAPRVSLWWNWLRKKGGSIKYRGTPLVAGRGSTRD